MTKLMRRAAAILLGVSACATAPIPSGAGRSVPVPAPSPKSDAARADSEQVLERGGELDLALLPRSTIVRAGGELTAWGITQVPADSRLQAAYAIADADARAELIMAVRVGIASSLTATSTASSGSGAVGPDSQEVNEQIAQVSNGFLPSLSPAQHGWKKVRPAPGREVVMLVVSKISAREDALMSALTQGLKGKATDPAGEASEVLMKLGKGRPLGAQ
jgi:hypothetical protein